MENSENFIEGQSKRREEALWHAEMETIVDAKMWGWLQHPPYG